jgi:hypothetical protein
VNRKLARHLLSEIDSDPNAQRDFSSELAEALTYTLDMLDLCASEIEGAIVLSFGSDNGASVRSKLHSMLSNLEHPSK